MTFRTVWRMSPYVIVPRARASQDLDKGQRRFINMTNSGYRSAYLAPLSLSRLALTSLPTPTPTPAGRGASPWTRSPTRDLPLSHPPRLAALYCTVSPTSCAHSPRPLSPRLARHSIYYCSPRGSRRTSPAPLSPSVSPAASARSCLSTRSGWAREDAGGEEGALREAVGVREGEGAPTIWLKKILASARLAIWLRKILASARLAGGEGEG